MTKLTVAFLFLPLAACAANSGIQCHVGADCASGMCLSDGTCVPASSVDSALPDGGTMDSRTPDAESDGSTPADSAVDSSFDAGGACAPNHDGMIARMEVPIRAGLRATFMGATNVDFDTRGADVGGVKTWDLSGAFSGDHSVLVETRDPSGMWFAGDFPGATYVTELSLEQDLLGVFEITDSSLKLRGVVSPDDGLTRTDLSNDPAVDVLDFPLTMGKTWTSDVTVTGQALGVASFYSESYASEVDASGQLITPFGTFDVLRVRTELTRTVGLLVTHVVSYAFVSECFGTVATMIGDDNDTGAELTHLAEVRRLAP